MADGLALESQSSLKKGSVLITVVVIATSLIRVMVYFIPQIFPKYLLSARPVPKLNDVEGILLALKECNLVEMTNHKQINCGKVNEGKEPGVFRKNLQRDIIWIERESG